eukprot:13922473-Ditylum_brightwellii.AAC.1
MEDEENPAGKDSLDELMEQAKEAGEKQKVEVNDVFHTKQAKNEVKVSTKKEDKSVQERMREHEEDALEKEDGYATDIRMEWQQKCTDKNFNLPMAMIELLRKMVQVDP